MNPSLTPATSKEPDYGVSEIRANLRKLERHDLWVWGNAAIIILSLTALIVSLSVSLYLSGSRTVFGWNLSSAVRALVALVLIFTGQMIYQHLKLRKIQRELAEQQIEAEVFRRLAMFDPLTGLYNRRFAEQRLRAEIARSERRGLSMIVVLLDLNDFKKINDAYGHLAGDHVLKEFAKWLSRSTRGSDLAVRWAATNSCCCYSTVNLSNYPLCSEGWMDLQLNYMGRVCRCPLPWAGNRINREMSLRD